MTDILLRCEGYHVHATEEEIQHALLKIAKYECTDEKIEGGLRKKVRQLHQGKAIAEVKVKLPKRIS